MATRSWIMISQNFRLEWVGMFNNIFMGRKNTNRRLSKNLKCHNIWGIVLQKYQDIAKAACFGCVRPHPNYDMTWTTPFSILSYLPISIVFSIRTFWVAASRLVVYKVIQHSPYFEVISSKWGIFPKWWWYISKWKTLRLNKPTHQPANRSHLGVHLQAQVVPCTWGKWQAQPPPPPPRWLVNRDPYNGLWNNPDKTG